MGMIAYTSVQLGLSIQAGSRESIENDPKGIIRITKTII